MGKSARTSTSALCVKPRHIRDADELVEVALNTQDQDEVLNLRVSGDVKAALRHAAEAEDRSVSSMALRIIREWLQAQSRPLKHRGVAQMRRKKR